MPARLSRALVVVLVLFSGAVANDKNKPVLPEYVLRAQTVRVMIDPDAGEPLNQPNVNATARDNVEKALMDWGRYRLVLDGQESDLLIVIRTGDGRTSRPTMKGGPIDQRPVVVQSTDSNIHIGVQQGHPAGAPSADPQDRSPNISSENGPSEDSFEVHRGDVSDPLDSSPAWRYVAKDCLRARPKIAAVEEFRKAVADAEKPKVPKQP